MWRLTRTSQECDGTENERGVIAPLAAILMVALLGFGALAVDVGAMYSEKAQLQNGADSAALAVAQTCAKLAVSAPCAGDQKTQATPFANGNALDGASNVVSATVNAGTVDVTTETPVGAGGEHFSLYLARVLGINSAEIQASAQAKWTYPTKGISILPIVFATCEFVDDGLPQKILIQGGAQDCNGRNPSNGIIPGGFAWLEPKDKTGCTVLAEIGKWSISSQGGAVPNSCMDLFDPSKNPNLANSVVALPVYKYTCDGFPKAEFGTCKGDSVQYYIEKWAGFKLQAWDLTGQAKYNTSVFSTSEKGLYGTFVGYSADPALFTGGSTTPTGNVVVIGLTK